MKTINYRLILIFLCLLHVGAYAQLPDLYAGEVKVADESPEARNIALGELMGEVMVRVSGRSDIMSGEAAKALLKEAPSLVQQFRYRTVESSTDVVAPPEKYLSARFDAAALQRLMTQQGLPVWTGKRPRVLVWIAVEVGANRHLLNVAEDPDVGQALQRRAQARGMPLQLPLLDLQDQSAITSADVWADYAAAIREASQRYPHDVVLTARVRKQAEDFWSADWTLWRDENQRKFSTREKTLAQVLASGIDTAQDLLAMRLATHVASTRNVPRISVEGIYSLADYAQLMKLLNGMPRVGTVDVLEVDGERLLLGIQSSDNPDVLMQNLAVLPDLRQLPGRGGSVSGGDGDRQSYTADQYFSLIHGRE